MSMKDVFPTNDVTAKEIAIEHANTLISYAWDLMESSNPQMNAVGAELDRMARSVLNELEQPSHKTIRIDTLF